MNKLILFFVIILLLLGGWYLVVNKPAPIEDLHTQTKQNTQNTDKYTLNLNSASDFQPNVETQVDFTIKDAKGETVKDFLISHDKLMHFILVRDDLQDFQHIHPELDKNSGEFSIPIVFSGEGKYRLIADFVPAHGEKSTEINHIAAITYKDITVGNTAGVAKQNITPDKQTIRKEGEYEFSYILPKNIEVNKPTEIMLQVKKNGQPVKNMEEYLGAQAHGILFKTDDLAFAHLHAMGETMNHMMDSKMMTHGSLPKGPEIVFEHTFTQAGVYKLFTQFQVEGEVITTDYTLQVK